MTKADGLTVLLVEDNLGDVVLVREALQESGMRHQLHVCRDGVEAIDFLRNTVEPGENLRPDVVILDLNLPRRSGRDVLAEIDESPHLRTLSVAVFTSSHMERGICAEYPRVRSVFEQKTSDFRELVRTMERIGQFAQETARPLQQL